LSLLAKNAPDGNGPFAFFGVHGYGTFAFFQRETTMVAKLQKMIRGDVPLAREIFDDGNKRKLIPGLQKDGWPIFDLAGKRCALAGDLAVKIAEMRKGQAARKRRA
jgi:hypothetical protein